MAAFTRSQWNALLEDINSVRANPPEDTDCEPLPPLELVGPKHRWSKSDIAAAQNAIIDTCSSIEFDPIPERWEQETIEDLQSALSMAWCDCQDDCDPHEGDGAQFLIRTLTPQVVSNCFGQDPDATTPLCGLIHGMNVGPPGIIGRSWGVSRVPTVGVPTGVAGGSIDCQGNVVCESDDTLPNYHGIYVECGDCQSSGCQDALESAAEDVATMPTINYILIVQTFFASCEPCD